MDIDLLRTFLEVHKTRHFGRAADNLCITQSAVSARIKLLEERLGVAVFTRERNNIGLTHAGQKLLRHAESMVTTWHRARQEIALQDSSKVALSVGSTPGLWDVCVQAWVGRLYRELPEVVLAVEPHDPEVLVRRVLDGTLDLALDLEPPELGGLLRTEVRRVRLVLVASRPALALEDAVRERYILVDWGTTHAIAHATHFPELPTPAIRFGLGSMARAFLLEFGGAAYLAEPTVAADLRRGRLYRVPDAPVMERCAAAIYAADHERMEVIEAALQRLRQPVLLD